MTSLLKSYRYAMENFGSALIAMSIQRYEQKRLEGWDEEDASNYAYTALVDDCILNANEKRVMEFFDEMPPSQRTELEVLWLRALQRAASAAERQRDENLE